MAKHPEKWQAEIDDILARADWGKGLDWEEMFKSIMELMEVVLIASLGEMAVHSPEGREQIRRLLAEKGLPSETIEQTIAWMVQHSTRDWRDANDNRGYADN